MPVSTTQFFNNPTATATSAGWVKIVAVQADLPNAVGLTVGTIAYVAGETRFYRVNASATWVASTVVS